jgi:hypothetical protein
MLDILNNNYKGDLAMAKHKISKEQIEKWKEEYKHVYRVTLDGDDIIFRRLKRSEYISILKESGEANVADASDLQDKSFERQEAILKYTVIFPEDVDALIEESAGLSTVLADEILAKSGFVNVYTEEL